MNWKFPPLRLGRSVTLSVATVAAFLTQIPSHAEAQAANQYGGFDIAGSANQFTENQYASTRGWTVNAAFANGQFAYCYGEISRDGTMVRLGFDNLQWQLAVPVHTGSGEWQGTMEVDGDRRSAMGNATLDWTIAWLGLRELEQLKQGTYAVLGLGRVDYDFSLAGVTATSSKVEECVNRRGQPIAAQAQRGNTPTPRGNTSNVGQSVSATCETVFTGVYGCSVTLMAPEPSYQQVVQITGPNFDFMNYLVKKLHDSLAEVWISDAGGSWEYKGYWEPTHQGSDCLQPAANQTRPVQDALGQDAWLLCMR